MIVYYVVNYARHGRSQGGWAKGVRAPVPFGAGVVLVKCPNSKFLFLDCTSGPHDIPKFEMSASLWASSGYASLGISCTCLGAPDPGKSV